MEITATALQTVEVGQNVLFTETAVGGNTSMMHRDGSGLVSLRGMTQQCRARFKITFGANVAIPADGTVEPISLAIALNGEPVPSTLMIETPGAISQFNNVFSAIYIDVPNGCCSTLGVKNVSTIPIDVQNANLIVERVA